MGDHVFHSVSIEIPRDLSLLTRFYDELMKPNFPIAEELEPLEVWVEQLEGKSRRSTAAADSVQTKDSSQPPRRCTLNVIVVLDERREKILGGIVYEYYFPSNCALITYLVISSATRGQGLGIFLGLRAWQGMKAVSGRFGHKQPAVIFCEANDPEKIQDSDDAFSPVARLKAFQTMGVRQLDGFQYIQPALETGKEAARDMLLAVVVGPMTEKDEEGNPFVSSRDLKNFLTDLYTELEVSNLSCDEDFLSMMKILNGREKNFLKDFNLDRFKNKKNAKTANKQAETVPRSPSASGPRVVVVGSGLSGLACARQLHHSGYQVTILEGRHRIGGRIWTGRSFETRLDLGAAWLHGLDGNLIWDFAQQALPGMKTFKSNEQALELCKPNGERIDRDSIFEGYMKFLQLMEALKKKSEKEFPFPPEENSPPFDAEAPLNPIENKKSPFSHHSLPNSPQIPPAGASACRESVASALERLFASEPSFRYSSPTEKLVINHFFSQVESLQNARMEFLNARQFDFGEELEGGDHLLPEGFHNIILALSKGLDIQTGKEVSCIEYQRNSGPKCRVSVKEGPAVDCEAVLVTVPIGVHHSGLIKYQPALPAWKENSLKAIGSGLFNKCVLRFPTAFWPKSTEYWGFNVDPETAGSEDQMKAIGDLEKPHVTRSTCWFANLEPALNIPVLVGMLSGTLASRCELLTDKQVSDLVIQRLRLLFPGVEIPEPVDIQVTRWGRDPFSLGSYSFLKTGCSIQDFDNAALPVGNSLFFAGEHTSRHRFGYADGAFASGLREAGRIQEILQASREQQILSKL